MVTRLKDCIAPDFEEAHRNIKKEKYSEYWFRGGRGCFHADQFIQTEKGPVKISEVHAGELVYTLNEKTQEIELKPIISTLKYKNEEETFEVTLKNGKKIIATGDHEFFQVGGCVSLKHLIYLTCKKNKESVYVRRMEDDTELFEVRGINRGKATVTKLQNKRWEKGANKNIEASHKQEWILANNAKGRFWEESFNDGPQMDSNDLLRTSTRGRVGSQSQKWHKNRQSSGELRSSNTLRKYKSCSKNRTSSCKKRRGLQFFQTEERASNRDSQDCERKRKVLQQETVSRTVRSDRELHKGRSNKKKELLERLLNIDDIISFREVKVEKVYDIFVADNSNFILDIGKGIIVHNSTKSSFISIECILEIIKDPEANIVVFRRFENEIRDSVFGQLTWAINKLGLENSFKLQVSPFKITYIPTGQMIIFKGADNPLKIKSINLGRGYIKIAWFEEVDQFGGMAEIRNILQSLFRGTTKKQVAIFSYNPPKSARSWVNAETRVEKSGRFVHYSDYRTVPAEWLGSTFLEGAAHLKRTNFEAYRHEYLGEEVGTGLEVFTNVTLRPIPEGELEYFDNIYQGLDFGYAADPLAFTQMHFDAKHRILYLFFEIVETGLKNSVFADKLNEEQKDMTIMADGAEPKSIAELREDYGLKVSGAKKGPGSVEHGIKWLQDLNEIVIDSEKCPYGAKEFMNYSLNVDREGNVISKYPDKDNHVIDSVRYGCVQLINNARAEKRKSKTKVKPIPILNRWNK
jgi:PBSX family phage terminase large subunit